MSTSNLLLLPNDTTVPKEDKQGATTPTPNHRFLQGCPYQRTV